MKKFLAVAVATVLTAGASVAMAQCASCGTAAPAFGTPVYSSPAAPIYSQQYSAPAVYNSAPVYSAPAQAYSVPAQAYSAPVQAYSAPADCGCNGGMIQGGMIQGGMVDGGMIQGGMVDGGNTYTSDSSQLYVGSVVNGETVVSVGESTTMEASEGSTIEGSVEPSPDGGEVVSPPSEESAPAPEATEGDA